MKKGGYSKDKISFSLATVLLLGSLVFAAGNANAGFLDQLNKSLEAINDKLDRTQDEVADAQAKVDETRAQGDQSIADIEATQAKGSKTIDELKEFAGFSRD